MPDDNNQDQNNNQKVTFTPEQQARIDEIIREAQGRAASEVRAELDTTKRQLQEIQAQLLEARTALEQARTSNNSNNRQSNNSNADVEALQAQIAEMKNARQGIESQLQSLQQQLAAKDREVAAAKDREMNIRKEVALSKAAGKIGFVDLGSVMKLTADLVKYDEATGRFVVVNEQGQVRLNSAYEPMSLEEFYQEFAAKNPWTVRSDLKPGVGSTESQRSGLSGDGKYTVEQIFGPKSNAALANKLARENKAEYRRLKTIAQESGLI